jgi:putative flippase GtrA
MTWISAANSRSAGLFLLMRQFGLFVLVGLVCAALDVGAMLWLMGVGLTPLISASLGFVLGLVLNFFLHARMTFKARADGLRLWRFLWVVALNYGITLGFVAGASLWLGDPLLGKLLSLPAVALNGFFLSRLWVFR